MEKNNKKWKDNKTRFVFILAQHKIITWQQSNLLELFNVATKIIKINVNLLLSSSKWILFSLTLTLFLEPRRWLSPSLSGAFFAMIVTLCFGCLIITLSLTSRQLLLLEVCMSSKIFSTISFLLLFPLATSNDDICFYYYYFLKYALGVYQ